MTLTRLMNLTVGQGMYVPLEVGEVLPQKLGFSVHVRILDTEDPPEYKVVVKDNDHEIITARTERFTTDVLYNLCKYTERAQLEGRKGCHTFRKEWEYCQKMESIRCTKQH